MSVGVRYSFLARDLKKGDRLFRRFQTKAGTQLCWKKWNQPVRIYVGEPPAKAESDTFFFFFKLVKKIAGFK